MIRIPLVLAIAAAVVGLDHQRAEACSFAGNQEFFVDSDEEAVDTQPPRQPVVLAAEINRFDSDVGCGGSSSCDGIVTLTLDIEVGDDRTDAEAMGFSLRVVDGDLPVDLPSMPVRTGSGATAGGNARLLFFWDSDDPEIGTLEITPIDRGGNTGEPARVEISDPGTGGCRAGGRGGLAGALALLGLAWLATARRTPRNPGRRRSRTSDVA